MGWVVTHTAQKSWTKLGSGPQASSHSQRRAQFPLPYPARSVTPRELKGTDRASLTHFCGGTRKVVAKNGKFRPGWMCQGLGVKGSECGCVCDGWGGGMGGVGCGLRVPVFILPEPPRSQPGLQQAGVREPLLAVGPQRPLLPSSPEPRDCLQGRGPPPPACRTPSTHLHCPQNPIQTNWEP